MATSGRFGVGVVLAGVFAAASVTTASAEPAAAFARLRERATPVDSLAVFLDRYVGACDDPVEKAQCLAATRRTRQEMTGRSFYVTLDDRAARLLRPGRYDASTREYEFELTPFFDANGLALTDGSPLGQDAEGHPRLPLMSIRAVLGPAQLPMDMERLLRTQNVRIQLVFQPQGVWKLPGRGGRARLEGVKARFVAVRLLNARTGEDVAVRLADERG